MSKSKWTFETAQAVITRTGGMVTTKDVTEKSPTDPLGVKKIKLRHIWHPTAGIKVLGAIDYLIRVHGYLRVREK